MPSVTVEDLNRDVMGVFLEQTLDTERALRRWIKTHGAQEPMTSFTLYAGERCATFGIGDGHIAALDTDDSGDGTGPIRRFTGGDPNGAPKTRMLYGDEEQVAAKRITPLSIGADVLVAYLLEGRREGDWDDQGRGPRGPLEPKSRLCTQLVDVLKAEPRRESPDSSLLEWLETCGDPDTGAIVQAASQHISPGEPFIDDFAFRPVVTDGALWLGEVTDAIVIVEPSGAVRAGEESWAGLEAFLVQQVDRAGRRETNSML